jgi:hypothetical protein
LARLAGAGRTTCSGRPTSAAGKDAVPRVTVVSAIACGATIPVVAAVASAASPPSAVLIEGVSGKRARRGAWVSQETGPITSRILPREMFTNARTSAGSNCVPEHRVSSVRASSGVAGSLYERIEVITSKTSAIATIRPARGISAPAIPRG